MFHRQLIEKTTIAVTVSRAERPLKHSLSIEEVPDRRAHYTERRTGNSAIPAPDRGSLDNRSSAVPADMTGWGRARDPNRDQEIGQLLHSSFSCLSLLNPRHFMAQAQTRLAQPRCDCLLGQAQGRSQLCVRPSFHVTLAANQSGIRRVAARFGFRVLRFPSAGLD